MLLGTLIDLGVDAKELEQELNKLQVPGWGLTAERRSSYGITGIDVTVELPAEEHEQEHIHHDEHVHAELHDHADADAHRHKLYHHHKEQPKQEQHHEHGEHRYLPDIIKIIEDSSISQSAKTTALAVFPRSPKQKGRYTEKRRKKYTSMRWGHWTLSWISSGHLLVLICSGGCCLCFSSGGWLWN